MADAATIRAWAREQGMDVSARGAIPENIISAYDDWHSDPLPDPDAGVTEADFPPAPEPDGEGQAPKAERKPRPVRAPRKTAGKGWRNVFGGGTGKTKARAKSGPRTDLSEFAEDMWRDLAMLSAGMLPPVSRVLTVQAPYAGAVFDEAVRGIPLVDAVLQPIARTSVSLRALNGLLGPAFFTTAICISGEWDTLEDGRPVIGEDGRPVPTQRTAMMLAGLKYSLLQMSRTADLDKVRERAEVDAERMRKVDDLVDFIFGFPARAPAPANGGPPNPPPGPQPPSGQPGQVIVPTFVYPPPPQMDDAGARA